MKYVFEQYYDDRFISHINQDKLRDLLKQIIIDEYPKGCSTVSGLEQYIQVLEFITFCILKDEIPKYVANIINNGRRWRL